MFSATAPDRARSDALDGGIVAHYITRADDPLLPHFYAAYDAAFILPDEKEDLAGFQACFALNEGEQYEALSRLYGAYREIAILLTEGERGPVLGAANFIVFLGDGTDPSMSLSYIFVDPAQRRRGLFSLLMQLMQQEAVDSVRWPPGNVPHPLIFFETNDPVKMSPEDYALDSSHAGLDQIDRLKIWERRGARLIDFAYHQPPLSAHQSAETQLLLGVLGADAADLSACRLLAHLRRFFGVTVLKGQRPDDNPVAAPQLAALGAACARGETVALSGFDQIIAAAEKARQTFR
ncbi:MAG: hypothetical protein ACK46Q_01435 [Hyphomonas sp.]